MTYTKEQVLKIIGEDEIQVVGKNMDDFKYPNAKMKNLLRAEQRAKLNAMEKMKPKKTREVITYC